MDDASGPRAAPHDAKRKFTALRAAGDLDTFWSIVDFDDKASTLRCVGDEDRSTQGTRRTALARAIASQDDVVVDLSDLVFADSSLMIDLAMLSRRLRVSGRSLLLHSPQPQIMTLIELVGVHRLPGVTLDGPSPAIA